MKVVAVAAGIELPARCQCHADHPPHSPGLREVGQAGKWQTEIVYAITDLAAHQARPDELAA